MQESARCCCRCVNVDYAVFVKRLVKISLLIELYWLALWLAIYINIFMGDPMQ